MDKPSKFDSDLYGDSNERSNYHAYAPGDDDDEDDRMKDEIVEAAPARRSQINASQDLLRMEGEGDDNMEEYRQKNGSGLANTNISARENEVSGTCL